eukprot:EG_transcript_36872
MIQPVPPSSCSAKAPASKESKTTPIKATDVDKWILDFLNTRNRPYSPINVVDSSAGAIKKAAAEKALAALHAAGKITCKDLKHTIIVSLAAPASETAFRCGSPALGCLCDRRCRRVCLLPLPWTHPREPPAFVCV